MASRHYRNEKNAYRIIRSVQNIANLDIIQKKNGEWSSDIILKEINSLLHKKIIELPPNINLREQTFVVS